MLLLPARGNQGPSFASLEENTHAVSRGVNLRSRAETVKRIFKHRVPVMMLNSICRVPGGQLLKAYGTKYNSGMYPDAYRRPWRSIQPFCSSYSQGSKTKKVIKHAPRKGARRFDVECCRDALIDASLG